MQFSCLSFGHHMILSPFALLLCLMLLLVCSFQLMCTAKSCVQGETLFAQTHDANGKGSLLNRGPCVLYTVLMFHQNRGTYTLRLFVIYQRTIPTAWSMDVYTVRTYMCTLQNKETTQIQKGKHKNNLGNNYKKK